MQYVPPFALYALLGEITQSEDSVTLPLEAFHTMLRAIYGGEAFDAAWYRRTYPDVAAAIAEGAVPDELTHFVRFGFLENRRPRAYDVDARWYEDTYKDVALAIRSGMVSDARSHFNNDGFLEPRAPTPEAARTFAQFFEMTAHRSLALAAQAQASQGSAPARARKGLRG